MKPLIVTIGMIAMICCSSILVSAQTEQPQPAPGPQPQMPPRAPRPSDDPLGDSIFPPEMIMMHQRELALTDDQKAFMRGEINRTTTRFNELQWQLQDAMEALHETVKANSINEQQALSQLDKVLDNEREIKRLHMELAIRIKNKLTPEQQMKLQSMRPEKGPRPEGPDMGPGGPDGPGRPRRRPGPGGPGPRPDGQPQPDGQMVPDNPLVP